MKAELKDAINFANAPMAERDELARDVWDIMDALFEMMTNLSDLQTQHK